MKILLTGASSFTGMWFVKELAEAGHRITAAFTKGLHDYQGLRKERIAKVLQWCTPLFSSPFGSDSFLEFLNEGGEWDIFCHHGADVADYKNPDFDYCSALVKNTKNLKNVLQALKEKNCSKILLTGSVFEPGEGEGSDSLRAVSPYGLSKGLTAEVFKFFSAIFEMKLGKFVIPNPFGPYEEPKFTSFLIRSWYERKTPIVSTPDYIRDNIPVTLLAKSYREFAENLAAGPGFEKFNPSFYAETQKTFANRFAKEMEKRLNLTCKLTFASQKEFLEPRKRINHNLLHPKSLEWKEEDFWDELAAYYKSTEQEPKK